MSDMLERFGSSGNSLIVTSAYFCTKSPCTNRGLVVLSRFMTFIDLSLGPLRGVNKLSHFCTPFLKKPSRTCMELVSCDHDLDLHNECSSLVNI